MSKDETDQLEGARLDALLCFNIYAANRAFGRFYQSAFSETELTYPKVVILEALSGAGPLSVSALSGMVGVEPNTLSPLLKKMANAGIITRERSADDDRRVDVAITPLGTEVLRRARQVVARVMVDMGFDQQQLNDAVGFLSKARDRLDAIEPLKLDLSDIIDS
jgi:DNA-binding MarR family transcriptional regulator